MEEIVHLFLGERHKIRDTTSSNICNLGKRDLSKVGSIYAISGIREELERRGWTKLNSMIQHLNRSIAIELFANIFQTKKDTNPYVSFVRGKQVRFSPDTINTLLETPTPLECGI